MTETNEATQTDVPTSDIDRIAGKIEAAIEGERRDYTIAALMSLAVFLQNPKLDGDKLIPIVESALQHVCRLLIEDDVLTSVGTQREAAGNGAVQDAQPKIILTDPKLMN